MAIAKTIRTMKAHTVSSTRTRRAARKNSSELTCDLPRLFLFLEVFVEKETQHRSLK